MQGTNGWVAFYLHKDRPDKTRTFASTSNRQTKHFLQIDGFFATNMCPYLLAFTSFNPWLVRLLVSVLGTGLCTTKICR